MYAYGSGAAASFFAFKVKSSPALLAEKLQLTQKLDSMRIASCEEFVDCLKVCPTFPVLFAAYFPSLSPRREPSV
jgi:3-hydroxy-3-methylglutaryl CoA synthase